MFSEWIHLEEDKCSEFYLCDNLSKEAVIRAQHEEFKQEAETVGEKDSVLCQHVANAWNATYAWNIGR